MQDGVALCKATAGMGIPVSVSACVGATCPFIIFESADIDSAVDAVIEAAFKKKREVTDINKDLYLLLTPHPHLFISLLTLSPPQVNWVLCIQESVHDSVVARLKIRMEGMKCVALRSDEDRTLVDAAVHEAEQQGATVSMKRQKATFKMSVHVNKALITFVSLLPS